MDVHQERGKLTQEMFGDVANDIARSPKTLHETTPAEGDCKSLSQK